MRNFASLPFNPIGEKHAKTHAKILTKLSNLMKENGFHEHVLPKGISVEGLSLAEKQFVDYSFASSCDERSLYFNEPCSLTIYSGGEFHLNVQALLQGFALSEAHKIASEAEEMLDRELDFAYSDRLGYLASDIALCGSGIEISVCLFLPAIRHGSRYSDAQREAISQGARLSPFLSKYDNAGDLYVLSYIPSPALDEKKAILDFSTLVNNLVESEIRCERMVFSNRSTLICDRAWRALGTLASARMLDEEELLSLASRIRLSLVLDTVCADAPPCEISLLNLLVSEGLNSSIISAAGSDCASHDNCKTYRAFEIKQHVLPLCSRLIGAAV